uniref:Uncharacterized protein n=1 Tax=Arundo donax TaxID=35708 RepID=A0A0A9CYD4_ARUDO
MKVCLQILVVDLFSSLLCQYSVKCFVTVQTHGSSFQTNLIHITRIKSTIVYTSPG